MGTKSQTALGFLEAFAVLFKLKDAAKAEVKPSSTVDYCK